MGINGNDSINWRESNLRVEGERRRRERRRSAVAIGIVITGLLACVAVMSSGCGPKGPVGRLLKYTGDAIKDELPKAVDHQWPDMAAAERAAWTLLEQDGSPPNVYWKLPGDLSNPCTSESGARGFQSVFTGACLAGMTLPVRGGAWIMAVRQTPTQPPSETALFHEYLHTALLFAGVPLPHHSEGGMKAPPERDAAFFEEVVRGNEALAAMGH